MNNTKMQNENVITPGNLSNTNITEVINTVINTNIITTKKKI